MLSVIAHDDSMHLTYHMVGMVFVLKVLTRAFSFRQRARASFQSQSGFVQRAVLFHSRHERRSLWGTFWWIWWASLRLSWMMLRNGLEEELDC